MKVNKKIFALLALNTLAAVPGEAAVNKTDKLYNNIMKNINADKSNNDNYKLIENILKQKNKELKDLYLQGDYIIKPEYLEWQIFFTGFYNHSNRGGDKDVYISSAAENNGKVVDLGVIIPVKGRKVSENNLKIISPAEPDININQGNITAPQINGTDFDFTGIEIPKAIDIYSGFSNTFAGEGFSKIGTYTDNVRYNSSGNTIYENLNVTSSGKTLFETDGSGNINITGVTSYNNGAVSGTTPASYTHGSMLTDTFSLISIGKDGNFSVNGDWELRSKPATYYPIYNNYGFLSYRPYYITADGKVEFSGNLDLTATNLTARQKVGLYLDLENQASLSGVTATLENKGTITVKDTGTALQLNAATKDGSVSGNLINSGTINLNTSGTFNNHGTGIQILLPAGESGKATVKIGDINVNGITDDGVYIRSNSYGNFLEVPSNVILDGSGGMITLNGERNQGVTVSRYMGSAGSTNGLDNIKNLNILVNGLQGTGISVAPSELDQNNDYVLNDKIVESIAFGANSKSSSFFSGEYFTNGKALVLDESLKNSMGIIDTGTMNAILTTQYDDSTVINNAPVEITGNAKAMYVFTTQWTTPYGYYSVKHPTIINNADIINNSSPYVQSGTTYGAVGLGALSYGTIIRNNGNIDMNGEHAAAIYNKATVESKSDHIIMGGNEGVVVYGSYGTVSTGFGNDYLPSISKISGSRLEVNGDNGAVLYSKGGNIELSPLTPGGSLEITANGKNTFAFYQEVLRIGSASLSGKFTINDTVNVNLKNGGIGFYYDGNWGNANIPGYFTNIVDVSNGQLNITADENSYKMVIGRATVNVSDLSNLNVPNVNFMGDSGKIKIFQGTVNIDTDSDIDKNNTNGDKTYRDLEIGQSTIINGNGIKITGTENSLAGIAQSAKYNETTSSVYNNGIIDLKGDSSIGIYNKRGYTSNTGVIDAEGNQSTGLYGVSGYNENTGEIRIKDNGIGIYSTTYLDPADNPYNSSFSTIYNNGKVVSTGGNKSVGIFANNNTSYGYMNLTLDGNSDIDVSSSEGGVGIYGIKTNINGWSNSGKITVGENGTGIYVKDSDLNLTDLEMNLSGDGAVGFYLDGTTNFTGTGNINIDGKGVTVFNVVNTGTFNQDFNISSTADSSYTFQNLKDRTSYYNSTASLGQGGVFISGVNSAVLLDQNSKLISSGSDLVALALDGSYPGLNNINGIPVSNKATNKGEISFGDNSAGLYVKNGASSLNEGSINLGNNSAGLYGIGAGVSVTNTGNINIGAYSAGVYLQDGDKITNNGNITGSGNNTAGLFLKGTGISEINNAGKIELSGNESAGIYADGTQTNTINNSGEITVGDSGAGIFNNNFNGTVTNAADITGGNESAGIYMNGGTLNHLSGDIKTGFGGAGVYVISGTANLNSGKLAVDDQDEVGIYGKEGAVIDNNMEINVGQNNYGIILDLGTTLINRNKSVLDENSVLLYSNNGSSVINETGAGVKMNASNSIAFYMENGGNLVNKAEIAGDSGIANIGIYTKGVNLNNSGDIKIGDSLIIDVKDPTLNSYSVGIYNQDSQNFRNTGNIEIGADAFGIYVDNNTNEALNTGNITSDSDGAVGIYTVKGTLKNTGDITLSGDKSIGIAATLGSKISNSGKLTINGNDSTGIYANLNSAVINEKTGAIYI